MTIGRIDVCAVAADSAEIMALAASDLGEPLVTDQGTTTVTMHQPAGDVTVSAYALGSGDGTVSATQQAARQRLTALIDHLRNEMTDTSGWTPDRLRLTAYGSPAELDGPVDWPLAASMTDTLGAKKPACAVITNDDAAAVLEALGGRPAASAWTDGTETLVLAIGPLVPGQRGCAS